MASIMSLPNLKNHVSRNGFDLSEKVAFTAKVGQLLPIMTKEVIPGDKFKINVKAFARTQPVNTAAFTRIRQYYDFFFVPFRQLWRSFPDYITQMNDNRVRSKNIIAALDVPITCPYFTSSAVSSYIYGLSKVVGTTPPTAVNETSWRDKYALNKDVCGFNRAFGSVKLLRYLGYGDFTKSIRLEINPPEIPVSQDITLNALPLAAYQKICEDYYRNSQWQDSSPWSYNFDYWDGRAALDLDTLLSKREGEGAHNALDLFSLRYVNWQKDYFMGLIPKNVNVSGNAGVISSILQIRELTALQKWNEISETNQKDYKSQIEAHFGVKMSSAMSELVTYLGGTSDALDISEVVNQNLSGDNSAHIQGKGVGVTDGYIDYEANEHGVIMCVYHAIPLLDYAIDGISPLNQKIKASSYAIPELDSVGLQTVPREQLSCPYFDSDYNRVPSSLGYAPRYFDYKTSYDRVLGAFLTTESSWTAPVSSKYVKEVMFGDQDYRFTYRSQKVNPSVMNPIFGVDANGEESTDQLLINTAFDVKAVRNLDYNGLPY